MFWALVMTLTIGGVEQEFVIDQAPSASGCIDQLYRTKRTHLYKPAGVQVTFACERTKVLKGGRK